MKIGIVGLGKFSDDFVRLFKIHPDVEEVWMKKELSIQ